MHDHCEIESFVVRYRHIIISYNKNYMSTLSVPLTPQLEEFINSMVRQGKAENKAQVVRQALRQFEEEEAVNALLQARKDVREGKVFYGDLDELAKKIK